MNKEDLIRFEAEVAQAFEEKKIHGPIHLAGGNEAELINIFADIRPEDWVLSTWRSHYHALLKGVPPERVMADILAGRSMMLNYPEYKFMTSAIVGGLVHIACGIAEKERVWCFVGDMAATTGDFHEATQYARGHNLDVRFIVEDNGFATNTPTADTWGYGTRQKIIAYNYTRTTPHCGCGTYVSF